MHNFVFRFMKWETFAFQNAARSIVKEGAQARGLCFGDAPASHAHRSSVNALCWQAERSLPFDSSSTAELDGFTLSLENKPLAYTLQQWA